MPAILADSTLIQQVLINLVTNATQAIGSRPGRVEIAITRQQIGLGDTFLQRHPNLGPGPFARVRITDTGPGIDPTVVHRIFEPFFTTKGPGEGTGLGLSVVHGIIESHGGAIEVASCPNAGTTFEILLPALDVAADESVGASGAPPVTTDSIVALTERSRAVASREFRHVLLIDDEASLLRIGERCLRQAGYEVTACAHPAQALDLFRQTPDRYDLVVTDFSMPGFSGIDVAAQLQAVRPGLPMLICTGYGAGLTREKVLQAGFAEVLQKPVEIADLLRAVHQALDQTLAGAGVG